MKVDDKDVGLTEYSCVYSACGTDHNLVLSGIGHLAVIKVIPLAVIFVLGVAGVCPNTNKVECTGS